MHAGGHRFDSVHLHHQGVALDPKSAGFSGRLRWSAEAFFDLNGTGERGPIAQFWSERTPDKREVDGSSPSRPTTKALPWTHSRRAFGGQLRLVAEAG